MESVGVGWFSLQDFYVASLSLGDIPGAMARVGSGEQVRDGVTVLSGRIRLKLRLMVHPAVNP
jgi:hypothetical protein